jgi:hypothetical protein
MIDIDKLHECVIKINNPELGELLYATPVYLHLMMGEVWLGSKENQYVYIGINDEHVNTTCSEFLKMLNIDQSDSEYPKKDIRVIHRGDGYHVIVNNQVFIFATYIKASEPIFWGGRYIDRVFIDLDGLSYLIPQDIYDTIIAHDGDIL